MQQIILRCRAVWACMSKMWIGRFNILLRKTIRGPDALQKMRQQSEAQESFKGLLSFYHPSVCLRGQSR
jgi:hypothetical protein